MKIRPLVAKLFRADWRLRRDVSEANGRFFAILLTPLKISHFNKSLLRKQHFRLTQFPGTRLLTCCRVSVSSTYYAVRVAEVIATSTVRWVSIFHSFCDVKLERKRSSDQFYPESSDMQTRFFNRSSKSFIKLAVSPRTDWLIDWLDWLIDVRCVSLEMCYVTGIVLLHYEMFV